MSGVGIVGRAAVGGETGAGLFGGAAGAGVAVGVAAGTSGSAERSRAIGTPRRRASNALCRWLRLQYRRGVRVPSWLTASPHHSHDRYSLPATFWVGNASLIPGTVAVTVTATRNPVSRHSDGNGARARRLDRGVRGRAVSSWGGRAVSSWDRGLARGWERGWACLPHHRSSDPVGRPGMPADMSPRRVAEGRHQAQGPGDAAPDRPRPASPRTSPTTAVRHRLHVHVPAATRSTRSTSTTSTRTTASPTESRTPMHHDPQASRPQHKARYRTHLGIPNEPEPQERMTP